MRLYSNPLIAINTQMRHILKICVIMSSIGKHTEIDESCYIVKIITFLSIAPRSIIDSIFSKMSKILTELPNTLYAICMKSKTHCQINL